MATLQTLDRGLETLDLVSRNPEGVSVAAISAHLGVHRAIAYRIVATLEERALVSRSADGLLRLGGGLMALAARFEPQLRAAAQPKLGALAAETEATAFLTVADGAECVVISVAAPDRGALSVGYRLGSRHPVGLGASGVAILAARPARDDDPEPVRAARRAGYAVSRGQIQKGAVGVASPLRAHPGGACVGVVAMADLDIDRVALLVRRCAESFG